MTNSMTMDRGVWSAKYLEPQIDSLQESIFVAMFLRRLFRQLMNEAPDHFRDKIKSVKIRDHSRLFQQINPKPLIVH